MSQENLEAQTVLVQQKKPKLIVNKLDDFILEKDQGNGEGTYWKALLSNGEIVYQDDNRPGSEPPSAWLRLKEYCEQYNIYPIEMWIIFRSHTEYCGKSNIGFFFSLGLLASPGMDKPTYKYICGPILDNHVLHVTAWRIPEIIPLEEEDRPIIGNEEKIICRNLGQLLTDTNAQNITT